MKTPTDRLFSALIVLVVAALAPATMAEEQGRSSLPEKLRAADYVFVGEATKMESLDAAGAVTAPGGEPPVAIRLEVSVGGVIRANGEEPLGATATVICASEIAPLLSAGAARKQFVGRERIYLVAGDPQRLKPVDVTPSLPIDRLPRVMATLKKIETKEPFYLEFKDGRLVYGPYEYKNGARGAIGSVEFTVRTAELDEFDAPGLEETLLRDIESRDHIKREKIRSRIKRLRLEREPPMPGKAAE